MRSLERRDSILRLITERKEILLKDLTKEYPHCSEMTLRRDLNALQDQQLIKRTHGGARVLLKSEISRRYAYSQRLTENVEAKKAIAKCALQFLKENCALYIDAGTTALEFVGLIPDIQIHTITNSPIIGLELIKSGNTSVILLGGSLGSSSLSLTGPISSRVLENLNIDIAFMGTNGFSIEKGFTNPHYGECELKSKVIERAGKTIVLMDHSKINKNSPFTFAGVRDVDHIVTDKAMNPGLMKKLHKLGVEVHHP
jgi:DeoR/GlpR family transcriptional regulator of sugar metabolism